MCASVYVVLTVLRIIRQNRKNDLILISKHSVIDLNQSGIGPFNVNGMYA